MHLPELIARTVLPAAGLVFGALLLTGVVGEGGRRGLRLASVAVIVALMSGVFGLQAWRSLADVRDLRRPAKIGYGAVSDQAARSNCVIASGLDEATGFFPWIRQRLPGAGAHVFVVQNHAEMPDPMCMTFNLLPSVQVADPRHAQWVVFFGPVASDWQRRIVPGSLVAWRPRYELARMA